MLSSSEDVKGNGVKILNFTRSCNVYKSLDSSAPLFKREGQSKRLSQKTYINKPYRFWKKREVQNIFLFTYYVFNVCNLYSQITNDTIFYQKFY